MTLEPFKPEHLDEIALDESQRLNAEDERAYRRHIASAGLAYTARVGGEILACVGVIDCSRAHGVLWSYTSARAHRYRVALHRSACRLLPLLGKPQLQATTDNLVSARWLETLGFHYHDTLPGYGRDGRDHWRYVRDF